MLEEPAHDFAGPGLGESLGETDIVGFGDGADFLGHMLAEFFAEPGVAGEPAFKGNEGDEGLAFQRIRPPDDGGFGDLRVADEGASTSAVPMRWPATLRTSSMRPTIQ